MPTINHEQPDTCWPTPQQELLLRAALLEGDAAIEAWREWRATLDFDNIDYGSQRLVPLLYQHLQRLGIDDPLMGRFKGHSRRSWYRNQLLFEQGADLLRAFHQAGVKTMILKGAALIALHYKHANLRPMSDFDLLVPVDQAQTAIKLLEERQWTPKSCSYEIFTPAYFSTIHAHGFEDAQQLGIDLHWNILMECGGSTADDDFWAAALETQVQGVPTLALNPTDQLLHTCVHGLRWNIIPPLRWVADAMTILNTSPEIEWNRLVDQARKRHLVLPVRNALNYLCDLLDAPIPLTTLHQLKAIPISITDHLEYQVQTHAPSLLGEAPRTWFLYRRRSSSPNIFPHLLLGYPKHLQQVWNVAHPWQLPLIMASKAMRNITNWTRTQMNPLLPRQD